VSARDAETEDKDKEIEPVEETVVKALLKHFTRSGFELDIDRLALKIMVLTSHRFVPHWARRLLSVVGETAIVIPIFLREALG